MVQKFSLITTTYTLEVRNGGRRTGWRVGGNSMCLQKDDVGSKGHHSENTGTVDAVSAMVTFQGPRGTGPCWPSKVPFDKWFK